MPTDLAFQRGLAANLPSPGTDGTFSLTTDTFALYYSNGSGQHLIGGSGSVTSVGLSMPADFTVSGSPVTGAGTLTAVWANESANRFLAGPSSGGAAAPTWRALVSADLPAGTGTVTSVALSAPAEFTVSGSPVTGTGTLTFTKANQSASLVYAGPTSGGAAAPTFRSLVAADLPTVPVAQGGTNTTSLTGKQIIVSTASAMVEAGAMTNGQLLIGNTGNTPSVAAITAGSNITITNAAGAITITATAMPPWWIG